MKNAETFKFEDSFQEYLLKEYDRRKKINSSYSIRAFARHLGVDQSLLSKFLKGTKDLNWETIEGCLAKLSAPAEVVEHFKEKKHNVTSDYSPLDESIIMAMSNWRYWAILEYFKIDQSPSNDTLAERFHMEVSEVEGILSTLEKMGFIELTKGKYKILKPNNSWLNNSQTSMARKELQKKLAQKSLESIEEVQVDNRHHCSLTVAIDKSKLPELKEKLNDLVAKFGKLSQKKSDIDEVYQLTVGFFPLTGIKD